MGTDEIPECVDGRWSMAGCRSAKVNDTTHRLQDVMIGKVLVYSLQSKYGQVYNP
jgi:hypothetical protein